MKYAKFAVCCLILLTMGLLSSTARGQENAGPRSALYRAILAGDVNQVQTLLDGGADVNAEFEDQTGPLYTACLMGHVQIAELLILRGADIEARGPGGETALIVAAGHPESRVLVRTLIEGGANVNAMDDQGFSPLWNACTLAGRPGVPEDAAVKTAALLLDRGAYADSFIRGGYTPLMFAARVGHEDLVRLLIQRGANVNARTEDGRAVLDLASEHAQVVQILKANGAAAE